MKMTVHVTGGHEETFVFRGCLPDTTDAQAISNAAQEIEADDRRFDEPVTFRVERDAEEKL